MTALFGGLFGLATVTTIIALLIQGTPERDDRSLVAAASGSASVEAAAAAAPPAGPKKRERVKLPGPWRISDLAKDPSARIIEDSVGAKSFIEALTDKGVPKDQVYRILKAFDGVRKFDKKNKSDRFIVALDRDSKRVRAFEYVVSTYEVFQAKEVEGILTASQLDMKLAEAEVVGAFYVGKNLAKSIEWGGFEPALAKTIDDALSGRMSTEGFEEGGTVRVIAKEVTALGEFAKYKELVALEYRPPDPSAAPVRVYTYEGKGARGYFDERGRQPDGSGWTSPVPGAPVTSRFNPKRMHPVLKKIQPHNGTDYGAPTGTPIYAVYRGKITQIGPAGPCGNMVSIAHPNGIESGYCHMSKFVPGMKVGQKVGTRQLIGYVGTTGRSTGPHLHFWTKRDGKFFDSETLKIDGFRVIPVDERAAFGVRKAELDARLDAIALPEPPPPDPVTASSPVASKDAAKDPSEDDEPAADAKKKGDKVATKDDPTADGDGDAALPGAAPGDVDPGDGDELIGPDLAHVPTTSKKEKEKK
jgi:murein DD-endopeptidase MepM/ murein hydrolase activator NlpD